MYESPIVLNTMYDDLKTYYNERTESYVCESVAKLGINVDKEELIRALSYDRNQYDKGFYDGVQSVSKWVSVDDYLPNVCTCYMVTRKIYECPDTQPYIMTDASFFDGTNWHNDNRINHNRNYLTDVIAWMPKPEPYKIN